MAERRAPEGTDAERQAALLRTLADKLPAMLAYWGTDLRCRFANRAYESSFGVTPEVMIGKHARDFLGPGYETYRPNLEAVLRGEAQQFEREVADPAGGAPRYFLVNYEFLDACGAPVVTKPFDMNRLRTTLSTVATAARAGARPGDPFVSAR